tara:strand:- start:633 stop:1025 length:393 start_codon:yes stop_codon:yes gene_type:complete
MSYCNVYKCDNNRDTYESNNSTLDEASYLERHSCKTDCSMNDIYSYHESHDIDNLPITYDQIINSRKTIHIDYGRRQTPLDIFLKVRGLESYSQKFYSLGAKTVRDLKFLEDSDFREIGISRKKLLIEIE